MSRRRSRKRTVTDNSSRPDGVTRGHLPAGSAVAGLSVKVRGGAVEVKAYRRSPGLGQPPRYEVELTEVGTRGQHWWTLGFEATSPADRDGVA